ncbi:hypothetical protein [Aquicella lusitana]|uniref:Uncharacterized protein n=1 Tax=Aquicella lusitana TaxID=254246 RepID=A0A370GNB1_9COXI|nr:hypothetical protein [Aquicella lusitana]RDI44766.1 hypothetical protein C8D86_10818 [Aquicella lusitana]VVC72963.1 hypothetical protein AQULUS_06890 [Aquicella lusitana]
MTFKLNEAPNLALSKISSHKTTRNCGTFWSIMCCIPSFGGSIGACDERKDAEFKGCYPRALSPQKKGGLTALIEALNDLRITDSELKKKANKETIVGQVQATLSILKEAATKNYLTEGYKQAVQAAYEELYTRAYQEQALRDRISEKTPLLTGHDYEKPKYFTMSK